MESKILQIMPATGWEAIFSDNKPDIPLIGWALVEYTADGNRWNGIDGLIVSDNKTVDLCDSFENFVKYEYVGT
jgi:hypothetical protein